MPDHRPARVYLIGFSGTGKSSVARLAAERLGWAALDTDAMIEEAAGRSIPEVFAQDGEKRFRELERAALQRASEHEQVVIATGGGVPVAIENRRLMAERGFVVALTARAETLVRRLQDAEGASERPLLTGDDLLGRIAGLLADRNRVYLLADAVVNTEGRSPEEVAAAVVDAVGGCDGWYAGRPERLLLPEEHETPPPTEPVWVEAQSRRYPAYVGWGLLDRAGNLLREHGLTGRAFVVSDTSVMPEHGDRVLLSLQNAGIEADAYAIPAGEEHKTLDTASTVYDWLAARKAERSDTVVALGGGVVGDLAGFVAATYVRGMPFVQMPTSLLAMVDASIGGKVAVDHPRGKNLIGAFYQPRFVLAAVGTLKTLPRATLVDGCAEAIKHALILDPALLDDLEARADDLLHVEPAVAVDIVRRNVAIKASVVSEDERDTGRRAILNYGHTTAHAIEAVTEYAVGHGVADAIGMMVAGEIGRRLGITPEGVIERQRAALSRYGLPLRAKDAGLRLDINAVLEAMTMDKKVRGGAVHWVLLEDVGRAVVRPDVPPDLVRDVVNEILG